MKYLLWVVCLLMVVSAQAQQRYFYGRITDDAGKAIPFAIVQVKDQNQGVYSNEQGIFSFQADLALQRTLIFFSLGYEKQELSAATLPKDSIIIRLVQKDFSLQAVTFVDKERRLAATLGRKNVSHTGDSYGKYGSEHAIFLQPIIPVRHALLKDIYVYITNEGIPSTRFRVHVYKADPETGMPGPDITDSNMIVHAENGNEWVHIDVSHKRIPVKRSGIFVSVEWVSGNGNVMKNMQSAKNPDVTLYNGQVLGLTDQYGPQSLAYARHVLLNDEWIQFPCPDYITPFSKCLNPMIYCTYSYLQPTD